MRKALRKTKTLPTRRHRSASKHGVGQCALGIEGIALVSLVVFFMVQLMLKSRPDDAGGLFPLLPTSASTRSDGANPSPQPRKGVAWSPQVYAIASSTKAPEKKEVKVTPKTPDADVPDVTPVPLPAPLDKPAERSGAEDAGKKESDASGRPQKRADQIKSTDSENIDSGDGSQDDSNTESQAQLPIIERRVKKAKRAKSEDPDHQPGVDRVEESGALGKSEKDFVSNQKDDKKAQESQSNDEDSRANGKEDGVGKGADTAASEDRDNKKDKEDDANGTGPLEENTITSESTKNDKGGLTNSSSGNSLPEVPEVERAIESNSSDNDNASANEESKDEATSSEGADEPGEAKARSKSKSKSKTEDKFRGVDLGVVDGVNITRLSFMFYRMVVTNPIESVLAFPCSMHSSWLPEVVARLDYDAPGFQFTCADESDKKLKPARKAFKRLESVEFLVAKVGEENAFPKVDMAFCWGAMHYWTIQESWAFFKMVSAAKVTHVLFENNPKVSNMHALHQTKTEEDSKPPTGVNVRKPPFLFLQASKTIREISVDEENPRVLLFYSVTSMRNGL